MLQAKRPAVPHAVNRQHEKQPRKVRKTQMDIRKVVFGGLVATAVAVPATAASASVPVFPPSFTLPTLAHSPFVFTAHTSLTNRPDSGGNGSWALDTIKRTLTITETGHSGSVYNFTATVSDTGTFKTISGAYTPNQGSPFTGKHIHGTVQGDVAGTADYSFTASKLPASTSNLGVPDTESGAPVTTPETTSSWYEQAFPAGTTFGGTGIGNWGWTYTTDAACGPSYGHGYGHGQGQGQGQVCGQGCGQGYGSGRGDKSGRGEGSGRGYGCGQGHNQGHGHSSLQPKNGAQKWVDAYNNGDGQLPGDGNITGA
jgi:hypothetical protein